jgi:hypothetical protein
MTTWQERDFDFEGNACTYYLLPKNMPPIFSSTGVEQESIWIPLFDIRVSESNGIENLLRKSIECFREDMPDAESVHCHIIRYVSCKNHIGIMTHSCKHVPLTDFTPTDAIESRKNSLLNPYEDRWGIVHPAKELGDKELEILCDYKLKLLENDYMIGDMLAFESSLFDV